MQALMVKQGHTASALALLALAALLVAVAAPGAIGDLNQIVPKEGYDPGLWWQRKQLPQYGFLKPGVTLFTAISEIVSPEWRAVFLRSGRTTRRLEVSHDLVGYVQIRSPQDALAYAQFLTSYWVRTTASDSDWRELTIAAPGDTSADGVGSRPRPGEPQQRLYGVLHEDEWKANRLSDPTVEQVGKDFIVRRWLWSVDARWGGQPRVTYVATGAVWLVAHRISPDGRVRETVIGKRKLRGIEIAVPMLR